MCENRKQVCTNCGVKTKYLIFGTTCSTCRKFERKHGRLPDKSERRIKVRGWIRCKRCKQDCIHHAKGMCINCYNYQHTKHKPRPADRFAQYCLNCGKPLNRSDPKNNQCHGKGLCRLCYQYQWMYGKPRPDRLWGKGPHGYCDCGKPANHIVTVRVMHHDEHYPLCDGCHAEHQRQVAWYGSPDITTKGNIQAPRKSAKLYGDD